jgi:hypothetical protein
MSKNNPATMVKGLEEIDDVLKEIDVLASTIGTSMDKIGGHETGNRAFTLRVMETQSIDTALVFFV